MATRPDIILAAGDINDPARLAQSQMLQMQAMQARQSMAGQNALKQVFSQPGAMTPDGQVSPNALKAVMQIDPNTGMELAKQNRAAMLDQLHIKAAELGNKMSETEIGKAKWDWMTSIASATTDAYENAVKSGADPQRALAAATATRDQMLSENGGQMSEEEESAARSRPLNIDEARAMAAQNKTWLAGKKEDERFGETVRHDKAQENIEQRRIDQDLWTATSDGLLLNKKTGQIRDPEGADFGVGGSISGDAPAVWNRMLSVEGGTDKSGNFRTSPKGAVGPAQLMPGTMVEAASAAGLKFDPQRARTDPAYNTRLGQAYFARLIDRYKGDMTKAVAAYNAGPGRVDAAVKSGGENWKQNLPAETQRYLAKVGGGGEGGPVRGNSVEQSTAEALANYDIPFSARLESTRRGQKILALARQLNPDFDQTDYAEKYKFKQGLGSSAPGTSGGKIVSANTVMQHIALLDQLARNMHNGNIPAANSIANWFRTHTGQSQVTNFNLAKQFVVNETLKAAAGGVLTGDDRQTMLNNISSSGSWRQLSDAMSEMQQMIGAQMASVKQQYKAITKKDDFDHYLLPRTKYVLGKIDPEDFGGGQQSQTSSGGWKIVKVTG